MAGGWTGEYLTQEQVWWQGISDLEQSQHWYKCAQSKLEDFKPHIGTVLGNWLTENQLSSLGAGAISKLYLSKSPFNILVDFEAMKSVILKDDDVAARTYLSKNKHSYIYENGNIFYPTSLSKLLLRLPHARMR